jgi:hypothetical protein
MSMTETTEVKAPAAKKKQKRRAAVRKTAPAPKADKFAGMTVKDCCHGCNADGCVISGKSYCAHPRKGGLHPSEQNDQGALTRRKEAEKRP